jgi:succinyl-diaminopimelate desuccinylase
MNIRKKFLNEVDLHSNEIIDFLKNLVKIPSENPPGDVSKLATYILDYLESHDLETEKIEPVENKVNVLGKLSGSGEKRAFLFNGHIDVVPSGSVDFWSFDPYGGIIKEDKMYGRGTGDMKGAIASAIMAAIILKKCNINLKGDFLLHCVADEEVDSVYGTKYLIENGYENPDNISMAVIGEGSVYNNRVYAQLAVMGVHRYSIKVRGKSAHESRPYEGENAVLKMCKVLLSLSEHNLNFIQHPLFPDPSWVAGSIIKGGVKDSIIPELCESNYSVRSVPGMTTESINVELLSVIEKLKKKDSSLNVEITPYS